MSLSCGTKPLEALSKEELIRLISEMERHTAASLLPQDAGSISADSMTNLVSDDDALMAAPPVRAGDSGSTAIPVPEEVPSALGSASVSKGALHMPTYTQQQQQRVALTSSSSRPDLPFSPGSPNNGVMAAGRTKSVVEDIVADGHRPSLVLQHHQSVGTSGLLHVFPRDGKYSPNKLVDYPNRPRNSESYASGLRSHSMDISGTIPLNCGDVSLAHPISASTSGSGLQEPLGSGSAESSEYEAFSNIDEVILDGAAQDRLAIRARKKESDIRHYMSNSYAGSDTSSTTASLCTNETNGNYHKEEEGEEKGSITRIPDTDVEATYSCRQQQRKTPKGTPARNGHFTSSSNRTMTVVNITAPHNDDEKDRHDFVKSVSVNTSTMMSVGGTQAKRGSISALSTNTQGNQSKTVVYQSTNTATPSTACSLPSDCASSEVANQSGADCVAGGDVTAAAECLTEAGATVKQVLSLFFVPSGHESEEVLEQTQAPATSSTSNEGTRGIGVHISKVPFPIPSSPPLLYHYHGAGMSLGSGSFIGSAVSLLNVQDMDRVRSSFRHREGGGSSLINHSGHYYPPDIVVPPSVFCNNLLGSPLGCGQENTETQKEDSDGTRTTTMRSESDLANTGNLISLHMEDSNSTSHSFPRGKPSSSSRVTPCEDVNIRTVGVTSSSNYSHKDHEGTSDASGRHTASTEGTALTISSKSVAARSPLGTHHSSPSVSDVSTRKTATLKKRKDAVTGVKYINEYRILKEVGRGSCGKVKLAYDGGENRLVAIKQVRRVDTRRRLGGPTRAQQSYQAFLREVDIMKKLRHKHIVSMYKVIDDPDADTLYLVMQYIDNGPIAHIEVRNGTEKVCEPIPPLELASYARQMMSGLEYLHRHNVVHRDIKPDNILVNKNKRVFLSDFGVAETFDTQYRERMERLLAQSMAQSMAMSMGGGRVGGPLVLGTRGTMLFIAPELWEGTRSYGKPVDMWAMGVTLYTLLTGRLPFRNLEEISNTSLPEIPTLYGAEWNRLLRGLLDRDAGRRLTAEQAKMIIRSILMSERTRSMSGRDAEVLRQQREAAAALHSPAMISAVLRRVSSSRNAGATEDKDTASQIQKCIRQQRPPAIVVTMPETADSVVAAAHASKEATPSSTQSRQQKQYSSGSSQDRTVDSVALVSGNGKVGEREHSGLHSSNANGGGTSSARCATADATSMHASRLAQGAPQLWRQRGRRQSSRNPLDELGWPLAGHARTSSSTIINNISGGGGMSGHGGGQQRESKVKKQVPNDAATINGSIAAENTAITHQEESRKSFSSAMLSGGKVQTDWSSSLFQPTEVPSAPMRLLQQSPSNAAVTISSDTELQLGHTLQIASPKSINTGNTLLSIVQSPLDVQNSECDGPTGTMATVPFRSRTTMVSMSHSPTTLTDNEALFTAPALGAPVPVIMTSCENSMPVNTELRVVSLTNATFRTLVETAETATVRQWLDVNGLGLCTSSCSGSYCHTTADWSCALSNGNNSIAGGSGDAGGSTQQQQQGNGATVLADEKESSCHGVVEQFAPEHDVAPAFIPKPPENSQQPTGASPRGRLLSFSSGIAATAGTRVVNEIGDSLQIIRRGSGANRELLWSSSKNGREVAPIHAPPRKKRSPSLYVLPGRPMQ